MASAAILSARDALDGPVDGIIDNYHACTAKKVYPALASYTCGTGSHGSTPHGGTCLTSAQVDALKKIYTGPINSEGQRLYSNWFWDAGIRTPPTAPGAGWVCVPKTLSELMTRWNSLSWRDDRAALVRAGRPSLAIQVQVAA